MIKVLTLLNKQGYENKIKGLLLFIEVLWQHSAAKCYR